MDPPGGVPPGEEPPQLVMRPVFCLVRSRAAGQQQYTTLESKATKRMANMAWTGHEGFSKLAPDLVKSGLDRLELEEVGFVERGSVTNMWASRTRSSSWTSCWTARKRVPGRR